MIPKVLAPLYVVAFGLAARFACGSGSQSHRGGGEGAEVLDAVKGDEVAVVVGGGVEVA